MTDSIFTKFWENKEAPVSVQEAQKIMQEGFFGPGKIKAIFGIDVESIPPVQFSKSDLEHAKKTGQKLILYIDKTNNGESLSVNKMNQIMKDKMSQGKDFLYHLDGAGKPVGLTNPSEASRGILKFNTGETPPLEWKLISPLLSGPMSNTYLAQVHQLAEYLQNSAFPKNKLPQEFKEAVEEFQKEKNNLQKLKDLAFQPEKGPEKKEELENFARALRQLKINKIARETITEAIYRLTLTQDENQETVWTRTPYGDEFENYLVASKSSVASGGDIYVQEFQPTNGPAGVNVRLSRNI